MDGEPGPFSYGRFSSPTVAEAERALGDLDGGEALLFASGAAATTSVVLALLAPGQTIALAEGAYYGTGVLLDELARWGIEHVEFDQRAPPPEQADLVWLEAPSNPFLTMPDFVAAVESTTTRAGCAAAASRSGIVRNGFDGASSQTRSAGGGGPVWSNSMCERPQRPSSPNSTPVP